MNVGNTRIESVLNTNFAMNNKVHEDVHWRNIGKYTNTDGKIDVVVFDLYDVVYYDKDLHMY